MKKLVSGFLVSSLACSSVAGIGSAESPVTVVINGDKQTFDQSPVIVNDSTLVPLRGVFEKLGAEVKWDGDSQKVTILKDTNIVTVTVGSKVAFQNGKPIELNVEPRLVSDRVMVPLRFVSEAIGAGVDWDQATRTVSITTAGNVGSNKAGNNGNLANQGDASKEKADSQSLTYQRAVEMAFAASDKLKNADADIQRTREVLDEISDEIDYIPAAGGNEAATKMFAGWSKAQIGYFMAKKQYEVGKETLEYSVKKAYNDVLQKQQARRLSDLKLENAAWQRRIVNAKVQNGLASEFEQKKVQQDYEEAVANRQAAVKALEDAYQKLNHLVGLPAEARYTLVDQPVFEKMEDVNLETHVSQVTSSSAAVWMAEQNVKLAKLDLDLYTFNIPGNEPYAAKEIDVDKAQNSAADVKKQLETTTRSLYYNIRQLEDQYGVLEANLAKAEEALKVVQAKFDVGMATADEVFQAKLAVEEIRKQMFDVTVNLDNYKIAFKKPWVLAGSA